jgi:ABC-type sugar transport system permease subunit
MFNESYILAGPGSSNTSLFQLIYQYAFKTFKLGYASALSMILIFVLLIISIVQFAVRRRQGEI